MRNTNTFNDNDVVLCFGKRMTLVCKMKNDEDLDGTKLSEPIKQTIWKVHDENRKTIYIAEDYIKIA